MELIGLIQNKIVLGMFLLSFQIVSAQVKTKIFNDKIPSEKLPFDKTIDIITSLNPPTEFLDLKNGTKLDKDNRFAYSVFTDIDFISQAGIYNEGQFNIYSMKIIANEALNISLEFDDFFLAEDAILSIYSEKELTDSITAFQNNQNNIWATRVYQGNYLNIVLKAKADQKEKCTIIISKVNFGYKKFGVQYGNPGASAACHVNVACNAGATWDEERNSVALIVANGEESCTGALILNECFTNIPYFLTANHCLQAGNVSNWVFQFQYWSTSCNSNIGMNEDIQFNGCQLRANNGATDFVLLELNQKPNTNSGLRYAGWSRETTNIQNTTLLHHPMGDVMKISVDNDTPTQQTVAGVQAWIIGLDLGTTQGGSSGSPWFNNDHRIIAQHYGTFTNNTNDPCQQPDKIGGRFDLSWTGNGTNSTRLSNWLDPENTGTSTTNTHNVSNLISVQQSSYGISGPTQFCISANYTFLNLPSSGASLQWYVNQPTGMISYSVSNNVLTVNRNWDGDIVIDATLTICGGITLVYHKNVRVGGNPITVTASQFSCDAVELNVTGAASNATYYWSSPGNNVLFNGTSTTATTTVGQIEALTTGDYIAVNTTNTCNQSINTGTVYEPFVRFIQDLYPEYTYLDHVAVSVNTTYYDTYYRWYMNDVLVKEGSSATWYSTSTDYDNRQCGENTIRVEVETNCSSNSSNQESFWWICGYRASSNVQLFPNPARDQVTIKLRQINDEKITNRLTDIREVKMYDKTGNVKKNMKYPVNTKNATVNITNLPMDIYFVEVSDGKNRARLQLSVLK